ncbi:MAG: choice-of-anchor D domain-containing protein [Candidatus Acidiferrales bacterium]
MRRLRIACAVTVLTLLGFAVALKLSAAGHARDGRNGTTTSASQYSSTKEDANAAKSGAAPEAVTPSPANANAPVIVATSISARSLAVEPQSQNSSNATSAENSSAPQSALLYLANADKGDRIFTLAATLNPLGSANPLASGSRLALFAGQVSPGSLGDGGAASGAEFDLKLDSLGMRSGVVVAPDGTIFVADTLNGTIRTIASAASSEPGIVRSVVGRYGPRQNFELIEPLGLALDRAGNLYIADRGANAVLMLHSAASASPGVLEILGHVISPASISVTLDGGKVFVASADTGAIVAINTKTRSIASAGISPANLGVDSQQRGSQKIIPAGLAVDGAGNLFVSFSGAGPGLDQILRLDASTANVKTVAHGLSSPGQIAFDSNGNLFLADQGTRRVLALRAAGVPANGVTLSPPTNQTPYGPEPVAGTSPTQTFTLTNDSTGTITQITSGFQGADPGDFTVLNTSCTGTLLSNTSCNLNVAFTPQATGSRSASLAVTYTSAGVQSTLTAAVTGTADDYEITLASGAMQQMTIPQGFAATYQLQIVPDDTFSGSVTLLCPLGSALPAATTCGISAGTTVTTPLVPTLTVTVTAGTPVPFNVTFQTTSVATVTSTTTTTSMVPGSGIFRRGDDMNWPGATFRNSAGVPTLSFLGAFGVLSAIICLMFVFHVFGAKRMLSVFAVCAIFALALAGCHHTSTTGIVVTPKGTYNFTVQGTAQGATRGFSVTMVVE